MNLTHLKYVLEVNKSKSINKAAENLFMSQPNLSRAIKELEDSLGITIFKRTSKGISPTLQGKEFLAKAKNIVMQIQEIETYYQKSSLRSSILRICLPHSGYLEKYLPDWVQSFLPAVCSKIIFKEADALETIQAVEQEKFPIGFIECLQHDKSSLFDLLKDKNLYFKEIYSYQPLLIFAKENLPAKGNSPITEILNDWTEISQNLWYMPETKKTQRPSKYLIQVTKQTALLTLLKHIPQSFAFAPPLSQETLKRYDLTVYKINPPSSPFPICNGFVIYHKNYTFTAYETAFLKKLQQNRI